MQKDDIQSSGIEQRYGAQLSGTLACFDRMILYGTLRGLCHTGALAGELSRLNLGVFDLKTFAQPLTDAIRQRASALALGRSMDHPVDHRHRAASRSLTPTLSPPRPDRATQRWADQQTNPAPHHSQDQLPE